MADEVKKYLDLEGLRVLWKQIKGKFIDKVTYEEFVTAVNEFMAESAAEHARLDAALAEEILRAKAAEAAEEARATEEEGKLAAQLNNKVEKFINTGANRSLIFNEADGGGAKFEHADGTWSYTGVNNGGKDGLAAQIYAVDSATLKGAKLDVTTNGMFYTTGEESGKPVAQRDVEANELVTKKDLVEVEVPEYSMVKDTEPGEYAAIYHLTKDGVNIGEAINIAKDQMLKSVTVKTCTEKGVPLPELEVGDKYIDFEFEVLDPTKAHSYIAVKDMVKPYTAGEGIVISAENEISVDTEVIATVDYVDDNISDTMSYVMQEDAAERAARIAGDNLKVDKQMDGTNGTAYIFNEQDGGGAKFVNNDGVESFVGVNDGGADGIAAQIYADKLVEGKWQGAKLDISNGGIYYTVGNKSASERMVEGNLLATMADIEAAEPQALTEDEIKVICQ